MSTGTYVPDYPEEMMRAFVKDIVAKIPDYNQETGVNAKAICEHLKISRSTCWLYLQRCIALDLVEIANSWGKEKFYRNKVIERTLKYKFNDAGPLPLTQVARDGMATESWAKNYYGMAAQFPRAIGQIYYLASQASQGSKLTKKSELKDVRLILEEVKKLFETRARVIDEMLRDERLWDWETFADTLMLDPDWHLSWQDAEAIYDGINKVHKDNYLN